MHMPSPLLIGGQMSMPSNFLIALEKRGIFLSGHLISLLKSLSPLHRFLQTCRLMDNVEGVFLSVNYDSWIGP